LLEAVSARNELISMQLSFSISYCFLIVMHACVPGRL
jgi:hypothetical protein